MSMFSRCDKLMNNDPFEEIFALNLGDFLTEHLISDELASKIKDKIGHGPDNLKKQLQELVSIYSIDNTLNLLGFNYNEDYVIYNAVAKTLLQMVEAEACHVFLAKDRLKGHFEHDLVLVGSSVDCCNKDYAYDIGHNLNEDDCVIQAFHSKKPVVVNVWQSAELFNPIEILNEHMVKTCMAFPMHHSGESLGVIVLEKYNDAEIAKEYFSLIEATATLFAASLHLQTLTEEAMALIKKEDPRESILKHLRAELTVVIGDLGDEQQVFVEKLAKAVDLKGSYENEHSAKVADLAKKICVDLGLNEKTKDLIYYAALLQNIGKIVLPQEIFDKKEKLSDDEWQKLQASPNVGVNILMRINFLSEVIPYIHYNKERWDGKGKPEGLKGLSIPFGSRVIAVADAYCALVTPRPFRKAFTHEQAMEIMKEEAGTKWDPTVVNALYNIDRN